MCGQLLCHTQGYFGRFRLVRHLPYKGSVKRFVLIDSGKRFVHLAGVVILLVIDAMMVSTSPGLSLLKPASC